MGSAGLLLALHQEDQSLGKKSREKTVRLTSVFFFGILLRPVSLQTGVLVGTNYGIDSSGLGSQARMHWMDTLEHSCILYGIYGISKISFFLCFQIYTFAGKIVLSLGSLLWTVETCFLLLVCSVLMGQVSSLAAMKRDVSLAATSSQTDRDEWNNFVVKGE